VRLLLDAHVSGPRVGGPLRDNGHDVRALDQEPELEGLEDDDVLALASEDERILVTHNVADFPEILREWAAGGRSHAGVILVYGIAHSEFGLILRGIQRWLELRSRQEEWLDFPAVVSREFASS
jgi:predicted nuclease of predicted toxin-antitoxin system